LDLRAAELSIPVARTAAWAITDLELDARGSRFSLSGERELRIACPLAGEHQVENAATAAVALTRLGVSDSAIEAGIAQASWPGRLEHISEHPEIILDGAHNPAGARALAAYIDRFYAHRTVRLIYGAMRDKAVAEISGILFPRARQVIVTAPRQARALSPEAMLEITDHPDLQSAPTIEDALDLVRGASESDVIFITGSLFLVAEARALLGGTGDRLWSSAGRPVF
jgi:folylpolyglutamate synthase/dihydropteroate synthase